MALCTILPLTSSGKVALLLALSMGGALSSVALAQEARAEVVDLVLRKVAVQPTKANGDSWDPLGGKPDLRVGIACGSKRYKSPVKSDTYVHDFKAKALRVRVGDIVEIVVRDQDAAVDDEIGRVKIAITAEQIAAGGASWVSFGRVKELHLQLRR